MSSFELPKELWMAVLKRIQEVGDWGRLQQVSRVFNDIIRGQCWTQVNQLKLEVHQVEVNGQRLALSDPKLALLGKELAQKANKIQTVSLTTNGDSLPEDAGGIVLTCLASASLKVKELDIQIIVSGNTPAPLPLASFVSSIQGTLETLTYYCRGPITMPEFHQAFRSCPALKTIDIVVGDISMAESLLYQKIQLQLVRITEWQGPPLPASAWINTGAHLTTCHFGINAISLLKAYTQAIQQQNLMADHPLKTIKTLSIIGRPESPIPFQLFPDLECMNVFSGISTGVLNAVVGGFLAQYKDAPGNRRFLNIRMMGVNVPLLPLAEVLQQMVCPVASADDIEPEVQELSFVRGNATAKAIIRNVLPALAALIDP